MVLPAGSRRHFRHLVRCGDTAACRARCQDRPARQGVGAVAVLRPCCQFQPYRIHHPLWRLSGHQVAEVERGNIAARLAKNAYAIAAANRSVECASGRGSKCREAETQLSQARSALRSSAPIRAADPAAERLATLFGVSEAAVALYSPMALPLGLELGGFIFLAIGLSPRGQQPDWLRKRPRKKAKRKSKRQVRDAISSP
jgi:hypothetical protein